MADDLIMPKEYLTTENTGYFAGLWHSKETYYTREYIEYITERDRRSPRPKRMKEALPVPSIGFNNAKRKPAPRKCKNESCGKEFTPITPTKKFCSEACREERARIMKDAWWAGNKDRIARNRKKEREMTRAKATRDE